MRTSRAASRADLPDFRPLLHHLAKLGADRTQVRIHRRKTVTMIDDYRAPGKIHIRVRQGDLAGRRCDNRRASRRGDIDP